MAKKKKKIIPESEMITITRKEYDYLLSFCPGRRVCENTVYHADGIITGPRQSLMEDHLIQMQKDAFQLSSKLFREKQEKWTSEFGIKKDRLDISKERAEKIILQYKSDNPTAPEYVNPWEK